MKIKNRNNNSLGGVIFDISNYIFLAVFSITTILPFLYIIGGSFAQDIEFRTKPFFIIPTHTTLNSYIYIFSSNTLIKSILNSVLITSVGTFICLFATITMAYPLSRKDLLGRNFILNAIIFTMVFGGGMIPSYFVVKQLHLLNSFWALWLPGAIATGNLIIIKNFFQELPPGLEEAAKIDGCSDIEVLIKIVMPLSMPIIATFGLFYAVGHWNSWFGALMYLNDSKKWPLQIILRQIVIMSQGTLADQGALDPSFVKPPEEGMKMAVIVVGVIPILMVYPFLQKHFAKGVMIGAIKG